MLHRNIPSTGETIPVMGLGTWLTFDVTGESPLEPLKQVTAGFYDAGGRLIDSSPMYGRSEAVVGELTQASGKADDFFYATKVWTRGKQAGIKQIEQSFQYLRRSIIDLLQIHNLLDWEIHLDTLRDLKVAGRIRYIGVTHYTDAAHADLEKVLRQVPVDFVQFNYGMFSRNAEKRLLPAAADLGVAVLVNRPFGEGSFFNNLKGQSLPEWAKEYEIESWAQYLLKFIISHPAVTAVIPATRNPVHAADNMRAAHGPVPDARMREKMAEWVNAMV